MPIIKSAKKRVKTAAKATVRNLVHRRRLHDSQKKFYDFVKEKEFKKAEEQLSSVYKVVDTCAKRNIIHENKAARLKAKAARALASISTKATAKKAPAKKAAPKTEKKAAA